MWATVARMPTAARIPVVPVALAAAMFLSVGFVGVWHYGMNYWLYRGFAPPRDPTYVRTQGSVERFQLATPALGGRTQDVYVYLPPGYSSHPARRYSVLYLLHGFPGRPLAFVETVRMGVVEDSLVARNKQQPLILVMPFGSTGTFTDEEWVNGAGRNAAWETFVARDVVRAIDARYRTIQTAAGRAIGGLSEGGFGAINIAFHHPHEFSVVESWSGYQRPDKLHAIYGRSLSLLARNDPAAAVARLAPTLRRAHTYLWFYSGATDPLRTQNELFAAALAAGRIPHDYFEAQGGHNWALWRLEAVGAYRAAASRLARG